MLMVIASVTVTNLYCNYLYNYRNNIKQMCGVRPWGLKGSSNRQGGGAVGVWTENIVYCQRIKIDLSQMTASRSSVCDVFIKLGSVSCKHAGYVFVIFWVFVLRTCEKCVKFKWNLKVIKQHTEKWNNKKIMISWQQPNQ